MAAQSVSARLFAYPVRHRVHSEQGKLRNSGKRHIRIICYSSLLQPDQPAGWTERGKPVLIVLPVAPKSLNDVLGPWLAEHVQQNRNMVRFLLPTADSANLYDNRNLLIIRH